MSPRNQKYVDNVMASERARASLALMDFMGNLAAKVKFQKPDDKIEPISEAMSYLQESAFELFDKIIDSISLIPMSEELVLKVKQLVLDYVDGFGNFYTDMLFDWTCSNLGPDDINLARKAVDARFGSTQSYLLDAIEVRCYKITAAQCSTSVDLIKLDQGIEPRKGGRPPSEFWDDMWAAIAAALYDGTLNPKTQADVERAMTEWISANGSSAANSTVRARARRLWDRVSRDV